MHSHSSISGLSHRSRFPSLRHVGERLYEEKEDDWESVRKPFEPRWAMHDRATLCFHAYYLHRLSYPYPLDPSRRNTLIRMVKIYYHLQDDTISVFEPPEHFDSFLALQEWLNSEGVEVNEAEEVPEESELKESEDAGEPR
ncbi:unnamed protein product [Darwinula stevensoni]|uniref:DM10 domain-containing protein n=1 Tax=Darwinula stevensoni TaxID=69355 RepID=A0A7R8XA95_9CRUS|nr:unnamed protein product [Darwinula stevensoni]CAG0885240.1 unnamed protein product [Darwinula stevensoni]